MLTNFEDCGDLCPPYQKQRNIDFYFSSSTFLLNHMKSKLKIGILTNFEDCGDICPPYKIIKNIRFLS